MNQIDILFSAMGHFLRSSLSLSGLAVQLFQGLTRASFLAITGGGIVTSSKEILNGKQVCSYYKFYNLWLGYIFPL